MLVTTRCVQCNATKRWLDERGVEYETHNVETDPEARLRAEQLGASAAPVVILPDGTWWQGFRPSQLEAALASTQRGLDASLTAAHGSPGTTTHA